MGVVLLPDMLPEPLKEALGIEKESSLSADGNRINFPTGESPAGRGTDCCYGVSCT